MPTPRQLARADMETRIVAVGRAQLATVGASELSLRAVARELGVVSSAVYRYVANRDALITALLVQCYDELADTMEAADAAVRPRSSYGRRWAAACGAFRDWGRAHPFDYALLYGSPVPGYAAPQDTVAPAARVTGVVVGLLGEMAASGFAPMLPPLDAPALAALGPIREMVGEDPGARVTAWGLTAWASIVGIVSLELFGHLHRGVEDYDAWFTTQVAYWGDQLVRPDSV